MSSFSKAVAFSLVLCALWACSKVENVCTDDAECPFGSFCLKPDKEGLCAWGELAPDDAGAWAILPKVEVSSNLTIETDSHNPKLKKLSTRMEPDSTPGSFSSEIQLHIRAYGAVSILEPAGSRGIRVDCYVQTQEKSYVERTCILVATIDGKYAFHASAENSNGKNSLAMEWIILPPHSSEYKPPDGE